MVRNQIKTKNRKIRNKTGLFLIALLLSLNILLAANPKKQEEKEVTTNDLPVISSIFGKTKDVKRRSHLIVTITPSLVTPDMFIPVSKTPTPKELQELPKSEEKQ